MFNFYSQHPAAHTIYSFTNRFYHWRGNHVFGDPFPNTRQATKVVRETTVLFLTKKKKIAVHVYHTFWYLFIDVHCPRIREKETLVTIYIKEHEKKKSNCSPHSVSKSFRRCRLSFEAMYVVFFTHFSIFTTFGHTLKQLFYTRSY